MRKHTVTKRNAVRGLLAADVLSASGDELSLHEAYDWNRGFYSHVPTINAPSRNLVAFTCHATAKRCQIMAES